MVVTAMDMFDWLDGASGFSIETVEVTSSAFGDLRRGVRSILRTLHEGDDQGSRDLGDKLRVAMSGWLTGPAEFDHSIRESLRILGEPRDVQAGGEQMHEALMSRHYEQPTKWLEARTRSGRNSAIESRQSLNSAATSESTVRGGRGSRSRNCC